MGLINREALLAEYDRVYVGEPGKARKLIDNAPTIELRCEDCESFNKTRLLIPQPERKKGKWINIRHDNIAECSRCGITGRAWMNFCFDCGADMREETK